MRHPEQEGDWIDAARAMILAVGAAFLVAYALTEGAWWYVLAGVALLLLGLRSAFRFLPRRTDGARVQWMAVCAAVVIPLLWVGVAVGGVVTYVVAAAAVLGAPFIAGWLVPEDIPDA